jgi:hypothetical protein
MNGDGAIRVLGLLEHSFALAELEAATGLLIEVETDAGYRQLIGPYPKDTVEVFTAVERLRAEEDASDDVPNTYAVRLLYPTSFAK